MKKLSLLICLLAFGCAHNLAGTGSSTGLDDFATGDTVTAAKLNAMKDGIDDNDDRLDTVEALTGPVFSDGDGTYTSLSDVSSTEVGYLDGVTSAIQDQFDALGTASTRDSEDSLTDGANLPDGAAVIDHIDGRLGTTASLYLPPQGFTVMNPNDLDDTSRDRTLLFTNWLGGTVTITAIHAWSDTDNTVFDLMECTDHGLSSCASIQTVTIATDEDDGFTADYTGLSIDIESEHVVYIDFDNDDDPKQVHGTVMF